MFFNINNIKSIKNVITAGLYGKIFSFNGYYFINLYDVTEKNVESIPIHRVYIESMTPEEIFRCLEMISTSTGLSLINRLRLRNEASIRTYLPHPLHSSTIDKQSDIAFVKIFHWIEIFKIILGTQFLVYLVTRKMSTRTLKWAEDGIIEKLVTDDFAEHLLNKRPLYDTLDIIKVHVSSYLREFFTPRIDPVLHFSRGALALAIKLVADKKELYSRPGFQFELF